MHSGTYKQEELQNCHFVKTILMIFVVLYHSVVFWTGGWFTKNPKETSDILSLFSEWLKSFHIYAFTLVSGYIFYYLRYEQGKYDKLVPFIKNKLKRLIIPYIFIALIWAIPIGEMFYKSSASEIVVKYVFAIAPSQLWFLIMLFNVFLMSYLLGDIFKKRISSGLIIVLGMYIFSLLGERVIPNVFMIWTSFRYMIMFWIGFKMRQNGSEYIRKIPSVIYLVINIGFLAVSMYTKRFDSTALKVVNIGVQFMLSVSGAIMAFVLLQAIAHKINCNAGIWTYLGKLSMGVYLLHQQFIFICIHLLNGKVNPYILSGINMIVALGMSLLVTNILMKYKITRFLLGEK